MNKVFGFKFQEDYWIGRQTSEEGRRAQHLKRCEYNKQCKHAGPNGNTYNNVNSSAIKLQQRWFECFFYSLTHISFFSINWINQVSIRFFNFHGTTKHSVYPLWWSIFDRKGTASKQVTIISDRSDILIGTLHPENQ